MHACIFNIQRFSLHDGPGVRTTVFFKGCTMRCAWCANPESLERGEQLLLTPDKCVGCGACVTVCPAEAMALSAGRARVDRTRCTACGACVMVCPGEALAISGREYSLAEVMAECLKDKEFYEDSKGGVTLSGGEVTVQAAFASALLKELRGHGVHTALETNGFAEADAFAATAALADMLLFDVKHHDAGQHERGTGVPGDVVLGNLRAALRLGPEVLVRIPVIRNYNNSLEDAAAFGKLLSSLGVRRAQLLPFHQLGESKYAMLGLPYMLGGLAPLHKEDLEDYRSVMRIEGVEEVIL